MKTQTFIAFIALFVLPAMIGVSAMKLRHDHERTKERVAKMRDQAHEQKAIQDELCGIVRRLGVRVGRLEEATIKQESK